MADYRDIGYFNDGTVQNIAVDTTRRGQVYQATHDGEDKILPFMNRSFISFTYGGKKIEEFDLIATISGDRLNRKGYASFEDTVTTYDNLDGQFYWATHYKTNQMDFTLSTDGIDQKKLDAFLHWFRAGEIRELVLAEHPNRAILARVAEPPTLNLLPFEAMVNIIIDNQAYPTKTTLYKGDIELSLVMDEPHWYAITNILGKKDESGDIVRYINFWDDPNGEEVNIFASQDALKILYEDGIPLGSMIAQNMLLGNGAYANVSVDIRSRIWNPDASESITNRSGLSGGGACIDGTYNGVTYRGFIAGALINATDEGIEALAKGAEAYFYYAGTAPSPTVITFTLTPIMDGTSYYITTPCNNHTTPKYNTFTVESENKKELRFTTPNLYTSYNKCIEIFTTMTTVSTNSWETIREALRDQVRHPAARAWAIQCVNYEKANNHALGVNNLLSNMSYFLKKKTSGYPLCPAKFEFDSKTGAAQGTFSYRTVSTNATSGTNFASFGTLLENQVEDVGDMLKSNYIIIQDRNEPDEYGKIVGWNASNKKWSHRIYHDSDAELSNIQILYKNMYL